MKFLSEALRISGEIMTPELETLAFIRIGVE